MSTSTCLTILLLIGGVLGRSASPDDTYKHIGVFSDVVSRINFDGLGTVVDLTERVIRAIADGNTRPGDKSH